MTRKCLVEGCQSSASIGGTSFFSFPNRFKDPEIFDKWASFCNISKSTIDIYINSSSKICSRHFLPVCFNLGKYKTLKKGAIPTIKDYYPAEKSDLIDNGDIELQNSNNKPNSQLISFNQIFDYCKYKFLSPDSNYTIKQIENGFLLSIQNKIPPYGIAFTIRISEDKSVTFFKNGEEFPRKTFRTFFNKPYFITDLDKFNKLLDNILENINDFDSFDNAKNNFPFNKSNFEPHLHPLVDFLQEQINLCKIAPSSRRYSTNLIMWSLSIILKSSSVYDDLRSFFCIPSERWIRNLTSDLGKSVINDSVNTNFLKSQCDALDPDSRYVSLKFDEIQIKKRLDFRSNNLYGYASNENNSLANHVQAFMVKSLRGNYKEIVKMIPVFKQNSDFLLKSLVEVINLVENQGFRIVVITCDNSSINSNVVRHLTENGKNSFINSNIYPGNKIFFLFDAPHVLKCIRNCWINCQSTNKVLTFPSFDNFDNFERASFQEIVKIYNEEKQILKYAHKLTSRSLFPNSLERQKVNLALKIFDSSTSAALKIKYGRDNGTATFIDLIIKFWDIFNINNFTKGFHKNNSYSSPFFSINDHRLNFLYKFYDWLEHWEKSPGSGKLSKQTFFSLKLSMKNMRGLIKYLIECVNFKYVLTAYFQTDCLESVFGLYRQSNGGNFHISYAQIIDSEKKNRLRNMLKLNKDLSNLCDFKGTINDNDVYNIDFNKLKVNKKDFYNYNEKNFDVTVYIAGYIAKKILCTYDCSCCPDFFTTQDFQIESEIKSEYFELLNRGNLTVPSKSFVIIILCCTIFFETYLINYMRMKDFNQLSVVKSFIQLLEFLEPVTLIDACEDNCRFKDAILKSLSILTNILMNNFCKSSNDSSLYKLYYGTSPNNSNTSKIRKFQ